jgi:hypothetical protein
MYDRVPRLVDLEEFGSGRQSVRLNNCLPQVSLTRPEREVVDLDDLRLEEGGVGGTACSSRHARANCLFKARLELRLLRPGHPERVRRPCITDVDDRAESSMAAEQMMTCASIGCHGTNDRMCKPIP